MQVFMVLVLTLTVWLSTTFGGPLPRIKQAQDALAHWHQTGTATPAEKALMEEVLFSDPPRDGSASLDATAGPDAFGYWWVDNQSGDTAHFSWIELCGDPEAQFGPTGDDAAAEIIWSFPFRFYGSTYTSAHVSTNGKITFQTADPDWYNRCANVDAAQPVISVHWDDLVAQQTEDCGSGTPRIKYRDFGDRLVIEWKHLWHFPYDGDDRRYSFQAVLFADGKIKLQYDTLNCEGYCNSATVGIDVPGPGGISYVCNGVPAACQLGHGRAIWFYQPGPHDLTVRVAGEDVLLRWVGVPGAPNYFVYRSPTQDIDIVPGNLLATTTDTTFTDAGVLGTPGVPYFYTVTAAMP